MKFFVKKEKKQKDPLLQTYFVSLLSLVLCVTMFLGTTFAWFSSDVSSQGNQIFVGTLSVKLSHWGKGYTEWKPVEGEEKILNPDIRWEPGYTTVEWLKLENTGDLSMNYRLKMASTAANAETVLAAIGQYFTVYANTASTYEDYAAAKPADFAALVADTNWVEVGTLSDVMAGKSIVSGQMAPKTAGAAENPTTQFAFAIHMDEQTPAVLEDETSVMGRKLENITVKLEAWQDNKEADAFDKDYDHLVTTAEELTAAFAEGGRAILAADIDMEGASLVLPKGKTLVLDLNGKKVSGKNTANDYDSLVRVCNGAALDVRDSSGAGKLYYEAGAKGATVHVEGMMNLYGGAVVQKSNGDSFGVDVRPNAWSEAFDTPTVFHMYGGRVDSGTGTQAIRLTVNSSASYEDATAECIIDGGEVTGKDGIFVQMLSFAYRPVTLTVNGGTISGEVAAVRVYAPDPTTVIGNDTTPIKITINGGTYVSKGTAEDAGRWHESNIIKFDSGDRAKIEAKTDIEISNGLTAGNGQ